MSTPKSTAARKKLHSPSKEEMDPIFTNAQRGTLENLRVLINAGVNVNKAQPSGATPLHAACESQHLECIEMLIKANANVNHCRNDGSTPLYMVRTAASTPRREALILDRHHPFLQAAWKGEGRKGRKIARVLLKAGANVNKARKDGGTAVMAAAQKGKTKCAR